MQADYIIKNITRQKSRTALTVLGIVIGIITITALGSLSEGITQFITGSLELSAGKIMVMQRGSGGFTTGFQGSDITEDQIDELRSLDGVREVTPVGFIISTGGFGGPQEVVVGIDPSSDAQFVGENVGMQDGRELLSDDSMAAMIGYTYAEKNDKEVGDFITVREEDFEIVGVIEKTGNANVDGSVMVNVRDVQEIRETDTHQVVYVVPFNVEDSETIAETIMAEYEELQAVTSKDMARQAATITSQIQTYTFGMGAIAAVVGGLGIMNTMVMAVMERKKEIGILKAIGATKLNIVSQFLAEAAIISLLGGVIGVASGSLMVTVITLAIEGLPLKITPSLIGIGVGFALTLGFIGGAYPSWKAAKLDPVEAIRY